MLSAAVELAILSQSNSALVIAVDNSSAKPWI
jgi:hypothetical protein